MREDQYEQLKNKIDKIEQEEKEKIEKRANKIKLNTEKIYYQIWKYIIKNIHKGDVDIRINIKENLNEEKSVLYTMEVNYIPRKLTYIKINPRQLIHLLLSDDLYVHLGEKQGKTQPLRIYASMTNLKEKVEKQKTLKYN